MKMVMREQKNGRLSLKEDCLRGSATPPADCSGHNMRKTVPIAGCGEWLYLAQARFGMGGYARMQAALNSLVPN
jgi:hypothetical protein